MALGPLARVAAQLVVAGIAVMAKALPNAYQQALNNAKKSGGAAAANAAKDGGGFMARRVMAREEALQVLNIEKGECTAEAVQKVRGPLTVGGWSVRQGGGTNARLLRWSCNCRNLCEG